MSRLATSTEAMARSRTTNSASVLPLSTSLVDLDSAETAMFAVGNGPRLCSKSPAPSAGWNGNCLGSPRRLRDEPGTQFMEFHASLNFLVDWNVAVVLPAVEGLRTAPQRDVSSRNCGSLGTLENPAERLQKLMRRFNLQDFARLRSAPDLRWCVAAACRECWSGEYLSSSHSGSGAEQYPLPTTRRRAS